VGQVANVVNAIVMENYAASELELLCVKAFDPGAGKPPISALEASCKSYFEARIENARIRDNVTTQSFVEKYSSNLGRIAGSDRRAFDIFDNRLTSEKKARVNEALARNPNNKLMNDFSKSMIFDIYRKLGDEFREILDKQ
jgi:hypothetical protein